MGRNDGHNRLKGAGVQVSEEGITMEQEKAVNKSTRRSAVKAEAGSAKPVPGGRAWLALAAHCQKSRFI
jgi:hypothetical protein